MKAISIGIHRRVGQEVIEIENGAQHGGTNTMARVSSRDFT